MALFIHAFSLILKHILYYYYLLFIYLFIVIIVIISLSFSSFIYCIVLYIRARKNITYNQSII